MHSSLADLSTEALAIGSANVDAVLSGNDCSTPIDKGTAQNPKASQASQQPLQLRLASAGLHCDAGIPALGLGCPPGPQSPLQPS